MLQVLKSLFGPRRRRYAAPAARRRAVRARFDAATTTAENRRHWANADGLSADAAASPEVRRLLRNRARYEVANNSYAKGIVLTIANGVVGTGPRLQVATDDDEVNVALERAFSDWADEVRLPEKLRTMRMARVTDGEAFVLLISNPRLATPVKLDLRLLEADQVSTPHLTLADPGAVDGIVFDEFGNPIEYHILRRHPGDVRAPGTVVAEFDRVPAEAVIHYYRVDRPGQSRGIPDITPALPLFAQLRRYTLAVIAAAETAADFAGLLYTEAPADSDSESADLPEIEIVPRMLVPLPSGWRAEQMRAEQPATTYEMFQRSIVAEITRCLLVPYNVASGNSSGFNFASGRLDTQAFYKSVEIERRQMERVILRRVFDAWFSEAVLIEGYLPQSVRALNVRIPLSWFWDGHEHVDPVKEAQAQAIRLASGLTTLAAEYAKQGRDWQAELVQRAREVGFAKALGLEMPSATTNEAIDESEGD